MKLSRSAFCSRRRRHRRRRLLAASCLLLPVAWLLLKAGCCLLVIALQRAFLCRSGFVVASLRLSGWVAVLLLLLFCWCCLLFFPHWSVMVTAVASGRSPHGEDPVAVGVIVTMSAPFAHCPSVLLFVAVAAVIAAAASSLLLVYCCLLPGCC